MDPDEKKIRVGFFYCPDTESDIRLGLTELYVVLGTILAF